LFNDGRTMTNDDSTTFDLQSSAVGDALVIAVSGDVDMTSAPALADAIDVVGDRIRRVIVDLSAVMFLDSSGLNALVRGKRALDAKEIGLRVVAPVDSVVRRVLEITQLTESLSVVDSLDQAVG
jgi:anti-anti-sigma factor